MRVWKAGWTWRSGELREREAILVDEDGTIVLAGPASEVERDARSREAPVEDLPRFALLPGLVSAHSHCFQVLLRGWADHPRDFKDWVSRCLYPLVLALDDDSLEAGALLCFGQMLRAGITTVGEFQYVHNAPDGTPRGNDLDRLVVRAARSAGIRIALLRTLYDARAREGQRRFAEPPAEAAARTRELARELEGDRAVTVLPAPHSLHGASAEAIRAGAEIARERGTRWHIHLAEQRDDVELSRERFGATPLRTLAALGVLDERTVVVHGIWLDESERALLAERGVALVSCPLTNLALGDGVLDLPDLVRRGVTVGLGTDMNAAPCILSEMRAAESLQRARLFRMGVLPNEARPGAAPARSARALLELGTSAGARTLGLEVGTLARGEPLDALLVDLADPSLAPAAALGGEALLNAVVSSMSPQAVSHVLVGGGVVVRDGVLVSREAREAGARVARGAWRGAVGSLSS
ncbi:amidohydrolase family protein [bacterium]|nr:amidohydrolase family protein [bacterium]